jgi:hypothetical protein
MAEETEESAAEKRIRLTRQIRDLGPEPPQYLDEKRRCPQRTLRAVQDASR